jgi:hypothetical protein
MKKFVYFFVAAVLILRLMPHPWNVSPVTALALFAGLHLRTRNGILLLLGVLFLSDLFLGWHATMPFTWSSFLLILWLGKGLKPGFSHHIFLRSLAGSSIFFVVTNLGVFLMQSLYPKTITGFWQCYIMALPFYRNMLLGDLVYVFALFGVFHVMTRQARSVVPVKA